MAVKTFTINRDKWGQGTLHTGGKFCCLGFYGLALGLTRDQLDYGAVPAACPAYRAVQEAAWLLGDSHLCNKLVEINDSDSLSPSEREEGIRSGFAAAGIEVTFT